MNTFAGVSYQKFEICETLQPVGRQFHWAPRWLDCGHRTQSGSYDPGGDRQVGISKLQTARSRLYGQLRQRPKAHFAGIFEIYKISIPLHRSDLKISVKSCQKFWHFCRIFREFCSFSTKSLIKIIIFCANFDEILSEFHVNFTKSLNIQNSCEICENL